MSCFFLKYNTEGGKSGCNRNKSSVNTTQINNTKK